MGELEHRPGSIIVLWVMTMMAYSMSESKLYILAAGVFIKDTYFPARRKVGVQNFFHLSCLVFHDYARIYVNLKCPYSLNFKNYF